MNIPAHTPQTTIPNFLILDRNKPEIIARNKIKNKTRPIHRVPLSLLNKNRSPNIKPKIAVVKNPRTKTVMPNIFSPTNNSIGPMETPRKKNTRLNLPMKLNKF